MIRNNLLKCKAIVYEDDLITQDIYFVHESDKLYHHTELFTQIVDDTMDEEIEYHEDMGYEMSYQDKMEMRQRVEKSFANRYVCHHTNAMKIFKN